VWTAGGTVGAALMGVVLQVGEMRSLLPFLPPSLSHILERMESSPLPPSLPPSLPPAVPGAFPPQ